MANVPQEPGHGSMHLLRRQALLDGHSSFNVHSGRQPAYGSPWYSGMHVQTPSLQLAFGPHGFGQQGSRSTGATAVK